MAGVGLGTAEVVFEGRLEDCLMREDPESALGQDLGVSKPCLSVPILSRDPFIIKWDKGTLSPFILSEIGYHFVAELELLSSAAPAGTTGGK